MLEILGQVASQPDAALLAEDYSRLIRFLAEGARTTGRPEHHALAFDAWLSLLRGPVLREGTGLDHAEAAWNELRRLPSTHAKELAARLLADPVCHDQTERRRELPVEIPLFLLRIIWDSLELTGRIHPWQSPEVESLLGAILKPEGDVATLAQKVLGTIPQNPEALSAISLRMRDLLGQGRAEPDARFLGLAIGRALGRILAEASGMAPDVRSQLETAKAWEILLGEWVNLCEDSDDPVSAFERYRSTVFRSLPSYEKSCLPWATSFLLTKIPGGPPQASGPRLVAKPRDRWLSREAGGPMRSIGEPRDSSRSHGSGRRRDRASGDRGGETAQDLPAAGPASAAWSARRRPVTPR